MKVLLLFLIVFFQSVNCAKILAIVPTPSYSHQVAFAGIWKELSLRGHDITLVTTDSIKGENLTSLRQIDVNFLYKVFEDFDYPAVISENKKSYFTILDILTKIFYEIEDRLLSHPPIKELIKNENSEGFDIVLAEAMAPVFYAFSYRFKCPLIVISSFDVLISAHSGIGNPNHPVLYPEHLLPFSNHLSFFERVFSTFHHLYMLYREHFILLPSRDYLIRKHFGTNYPDTYYFKTHVDMLFMNTNPILNTLRPIVPAVVEFGGGMHLGPVKKLPNDIKVFMDGAKEGVVYFSLGSNIKSNLLPNETKEILIKVFSELPYRVLWKFEEDNLPGKPKNVMIVKWAPQQDILRHEKVKVFITQGGMQSLEESIYSHIPMVGMPFFGDQNSNVKKLVAKGFGLFVDPRALDEGTLKSAILEVAENPKYKEKVKELAELALDQPMTGLEKAVWWTEYVIRNKGAKHLRSPAIDMPMYQYLLLDVIVFILAILIILLWIIYISLQTLVDALVFRIIPKEKGE